MLPIAIARDCQDISLGLALSRQYWILTEGAVLLEEILADEVTRTEAENQPMFRTDLDYDDLFLKRQEIAGSWVDLPTSEKQKYRTQLEYERDHGAPDLNDPEIIPAKNLSLIRKEVKARLDSHGAINILGLDALDFGESLVELAESVENIDDIREVYRIRKLATGSSKNSGISSKEALRIKNCFTQGRELFLAGRNGSLMVKPLNFFYSFTAYAYGIIILNNPLRYRKDMLPGSHGMAYLPDSIKAQFGGDCARGTFSDLVTAFPTHLIKTENLEFSIDCTESLIEFYKQRFDVSLGTLLSMVPEMSEYYKLTKGVHSRCFPLEIINANDPRSLIWEFHIGDGETRPPQEGIKEAFNDFDRSERHGKTVITVPASRAHNIKACIYTDIRGDLWYVDNPFYPVILLEVAVHFLSSSIFSNIMRYRPDEWGNVLLNDVSPSISLITRHYLSSFQRKLLVLVLRSVSRYLPYAASD